MKQSSEKLQAKVEAESQFARVAMAALVRAQDQARIDAARYGLEIVVSDPNEVRPKAVRKPKVKPLKPKRVPAGV